MKRSLKMIAGFFAAVMLLTACLTTGVLAAPAKPAEDLTALERYQLENLPGAPFADGVYILPNGMIISDAEAAKLYAKYYWYWYAANNKPVYPHPGFVVATREMKVDQYTISTLPFEHKPTYTYYSADKDIAAVDAKGRVFGVNPGETHITISQHGYVIAVIKVYVHKSPVPADAAIDIVIASTAGSLKIGETTKLYAYVTVNGKPNTYFPYELEYTVTDDKILSFDEKTNTVTALAVGKASILVRIKGTDITNYITFRVVSATSKPVYPSYPSYPVYPGIWYPGYVCPGDYYKYTIEYQWKYVGGEWKVVPVWVLKDEYKNNKDDKDEPAIPSTPVLTPDELEELKKQEEAAKKLAELNANIVLALEGKLEWHEVYSDIYGDSTYSAGVNYVLDNQLLTGNDDGTFAPNQKMTYSDVEKLFCKYLTLATADFQKTGILTYKDADAVIDREELALAFYKMAKYLKLDTSAKKNLNKYADVSALDDNCAAAFEWAIVNKVVSVTSTKLNPDKAVTKADLAQMMYRFNNFAK